MIIVGKPGSGKTSLMQKLVTDPHYYGGKFDRVLVVSPALKKLSFKTKAGNSNEKFNLKWIMGHIEKASRE